MSRLDIGVGDVHIPGAGATMAKPTKLDRRRMRLAKADARAKERAKRSKLLAAPQAASGKSIRIRMTASDGSHTTIHQRMSATFDEATNELCLGLPLDKTQALSSEATKLVWVQVARTGTWSGHPQGAFSITTATLDRMIENFRTQEFGRLQWDFDHYSAMPANSGNLPNTGKPAQGWAYDLKREGDRLYALTEWLPLARQYIENDQYQGVSPVINWAGKDRATGKDIGPVLTSFALTNTPFLTGMERPIAADINGVPEAPKGPMALTEITPEAHQSELSAKYSCHSLLTMLPRLKQVFGLHELSTAEHVQSALENYRAHLDALEGDGMGSHEGIDLSSYSQPLRELTNAHAGMDWYAILDIIDELLDAYLDQHGLPDFEESHGPIPGTEASAVPPVATAASLTGAPMDPTDKPEAVVAPAEAAAPAAVETTAPEVAPATVTAASAATEAPLPDPQLSAALLRIAALEAENKRLQASTSSLSAAQEATAEQLLCAEVDAAIATYKDAKGATEEMRPHLLSMLKATPDAFHAMYPAVDPDKRHLLLNLTGGDASNAAAPGARVEADTAAEVVPPPAEERPEALRLSITALTQKLIADSGYKLTWGAAQIKADELRRQALSK